MKRSFHPCAPLVATLLTLAACSSGTSSEDDSCRGVDSAVSDQAISLAKSNFTLPDGSVIDRVTFDGASALPLPANQQKFGVESVLALRSVVFFGGDEADSELSGVEGAVYLALGEDDSLIAPLGSFSEPFFDLAPPDDPGWSSWAQSVDDSSSLDDAFGCVAPNS